MVNRKRVDILHVLIEINNDRIEVYETAEENTGEGDLKDLFLKFKKTSMKCQGELIREILKSGGSVIEGPTTTGTIVSTWKDVTSAFTGKDKRALLDLCVYGEENTVEVYSIIMDDQTDHLDLSQIDMIESQLHHIKRDQRAIKAMRESMMVAPL